MSEKNKLEIFQRFVKDKVISYKHCLMLHLPAYLLVVTNLTFFLEPLFFISIAL